MVTRNVVANADPLDGFSCKRADNAQDYPVSPYFVLLSGMVFAIVLKCRTLNKGAELAPIGHDPFHGAAWFDRI